MSSKEAPDDSDDNDLCQWDAGKQQWLHVPKPRICSPISYGTADAKVATTDWLSYTQDVWKR